MVFRLSRPSRSRRGSNRMAAGARAVLPRHRTSRFRGSQTDAEGPAALRSLCSNPFRLWLKSRGTCFDRLSMSKNRTDRRADCENRDENKCLCRSRLNGDRERGTRGRIARLSCRARGLGFSAAGDQMAARPAANRASLASRQSDSRLATNFVLSCSTAKRLSEWAAQSAVVQASSPASGSDWKVS